MKHMIKAPHGIDTTIISSYFNGAYRPFIKAFLETRYMHKENPLFITPIIAKHQASDDVVIVRLKKPEHCSYQAGQYAVLSYAHFMPRPYSIASSPSDDYLEFHFKDSYTPEGFGHHMVKHARLGDEIICHEIQGKSLYNSTQSKNSVFLAGGVGIAPVKSILDTHFSQHTRFAGLFWGAQKPDDFYMLDWLETLRLAHPETPIIQSCETETPANNRFYHGFAIDALIHHLDDMSQLRFYIFGPPAMAYNAAERLAEAGIKKDQMICDFFDKTPQINVK